MEFSNQQVATAFALARNGRAEAVIDHNPAELVLAGTAPYRRFQALVSLSRGNLIRAGLSDDKAHYQAIKPGHEVLMWIAEAEVGSVVCFKSEDMDMKDWKARAQALRIEFAEHNREE